jgi:hypothetical protein
MQCIGSKSPQEIQPMNPIALGLVAPTTFNTDNSVSDQMRFQQQQQQQQQQLLLDEQRQLRQQHQAQVLCFQQNPLQGMLQQAANISKDTQEMNLMGNAQSNMGLNTQPTPSVGEVLSNTANEQNEAGGGGMLPWLDGRLTSPLLVLYGNVHRTDRHLLDQPANPSDSGFGIYSSS